jgi:hypothetical protein
VWELDESPGSDVALFTFGSYTNPGRTEPSYAFVNTVLRVKKAFGASFDAYYLRARKNDWYFSGAQGFDSLAMSLEGIGRVALRYRFTMFLGNSMGGYAAMLFGLPLRANAILAFSPQTRFDQPFCEQIGERRWREAYDAMRGEFEVDALALRCRWPDSVETDVEVHYGGGCKADEEYAMQLRALPGISLVGHEGLNHDLVHDLRKTGLLERIIHEKINNIQNV